MRRLSVAGLSLLLLGTLLWLFWLQMVSRQMTVSSLQLSIESVAPSPLPTPEPTEAITIDDYEFGEPVYHLSNRQRLSVIGWLPDNQRAIVATDEVQQIQVIDFRTNHAATFGAVGATYPKIVWLGKSEKLAYLENVAGEIRLRISGGEGESIVQPLTQNLVRDALTAQDDKLLVLEVGSQSPLLIDSTGEQEFLPPVSLQEFSINLALPAFFGPSMKWHPIEPKVAIYDRHGFVVLELDTGRVAPFDINQAQDFWVFDASWSPNGQKMALQYVQHDPPFDLVRLAILDIAAQKIQEFQVPLTWLSDVVWSPNGQQVLVAGHQIIDAQRVFEVYVVDISSGKSRKVELLSSYFLPTLENVNLAWSWDGKRLLFSCKPRDLSAVIALCESSVTIRGAR